MTPWSVNAVHRKDMEACGEVQMCLVSDMLIQVPYLGSFASSTPDKDWLQPKLPVDMFLGPIHSLLDHAGTLKPLLLMY